MRVRLLLLGISLVALMPSTALSEVRVFFSPHGGCDQALAELIQSASTDIDAACYTFTLDSIADELIAAQGRGVRVRVILDRSQAAQRCSRGERLLAAGVPVKVNAHSGLMHHKFLVADGRSVATGSFNWTKAAVERNDENLVLFLDEPAVARAFAAEFEEMWNGMGHFAALVPTDGAKQKLGASMFTTKTPRHEEIPRDLVLSGWIAVVALLAIGALFIAYRARRKQVFAYRRRKYSYPEVKAEPGKGGKSAPAEHYLSEEGC